MENAKIKKGDLVYVDIRDGFNAPLVAHCRYLGDLDIEQKQGEDLTFYILETLYHGVVYIDSMASDLIKIN